MGINTWSLLKEKIVLSSIHRSLKLQRMYVQNLCGYTIIQQHCSTLRCALMYINVWFPILTDIYILSSHSSQCNVLLLLPVIFSIQFTTSALISTHKTTFYYSPFMCTSSTLLKKRQPADLELNSNCYNGKSTTDKCDSMKIRRDLDPSIPCPEIIQWNHFMSRGRSRVKPGFPTNKPQLSRPTKDRNLSLSPS